LCVRGLSPGHADSAPGRALGQGPAQDSALQRTKPANKPGQCPRNRPGPVYRRKRALHACFRAGHACGTRTVRTCLYLTTHANTWENAGLCGGRRSTAMPSTMSSFVARSVPPSPVPTPAPPVLSGVPCPDPPRFLAWKGVAAASAARRRVRCYGMPECLASLLSNAASCRPLAVGGCGFVGFRSFWGADTMGKTRSSA